MDLLPCEARVVQESQLDCPTHQFVYTYLCVSSKSRTVVAQSCCRATKRNNSCVIFSKDGVTLFGLLKKLIYLTSSASMLQQCYALIQELKQADFLLCHDSITEAQLNSHVIAFHPPRFVLNTHAHTYSHVLSHSYVHFLSLFHTRTHTHTMHDVAVI